MRHILIRLFRRVLKVSVGGILVLLLLVALVLGSILGVQEFRIGRARRYAAQHPNDAAAQRNLAWALRGCSRNEEAIPAYRAWVRLVPDDPQPRLQLARLYQREHRYAEAVEVYEALLRLPQQALEADAWLGLAESRCKTGDGPAALEAFRQAIALRGVWANSFDVVERCLSQAGLDADIQTAYLDAVSLYPQNVQGYVRLAEKYRQRNKTLPKAVHAYRMAAALEPGNIEWRLALAQMLLWANEPAAALDANIEALHLDPQSMDGRMGVVEAHAALGDVHAAAEALELLLADVPTGGFSTGYVSYSRSGVYLMYARLLVVLGREDEAASMSVRSRRAALTELLWELKSPWRWEDLGMAYELAGKERLAAYAYQVSAWLAPRRPRPHLALARMLEAMGRTEAAAAARRDAVDRARKVTTQRAGSMYHVTHYLVPSLLGIGDYEEAARLAQEAIHADRENVFAYLYGAQALDRLGRYEELAAVCTAQLELVQDIERTRQWRFAVPAYYRLAKAREGLGDQAGADQMYAAAWDSIEYACCTGSYFALPPSVMPGFTPDLLADIERHVPLAAAL